MSRPWAPASRIACHGAFSRSPSAYFWFSPRRVSCSAWSILEPKGYGMGRQIEELAAFVARTRWEDVPEAVQRHAKITLLDTLGVILAGGERPEMRQLRERLSTTAGTGATVYARGWPVQDPRTAAMLNGIAGRSIELCEGLRLVSGQAALQVLPGVLAVGEQAGSSGRDILAAFVLGYEVAGRLASGFTPRPLAHQNGQVSLLAAAAAGAKLRGLDAGGISRAMRIATVLVLTPSYTNAVAGATALNIAGGMSGHAAALAPELALAGFEAQADAIQEALGQLVGGGFNPAPVAEDPAMSALAPKLRPARVTVTLTDGRQATHARDSHRGDFDEPFTEAELRAKFRELAGTVLTSEGAVQVEAAIDRSEAWPSLAELTDLCRRYSRA